jgi:hypothetical protein
MGTINTAAVAEAVGEGLVALRPALTWHLSSNHFPPVPTTMVDACIEAIEAAVDEDWDHPVELPEGITFRGHQAAPASALVEQHHLGFFVEAALYGDESYE